MQWLSDHLDSVVLALQAVFLAILYWLKKEFASKGDVDLAIKGERLLVDAKFDNQAVDVKAIGAAQSVAAGQVALLAQTVEALPTADDISEIRLTIERLGGDYRALRESVSNVDKHISSIGKSVDRIEGFMMEGRGQRA
jgi:hypothetical protein